MAVSSAQEASSAMPLLPYDVFLSFRGEDTRKTFTDHLYTALRGAGFRTFRDNEGIERGEDVKSELERAITQARCSIIVLSKNYASSGWCLDELVAIMKRRKSSKHVVVPVFYRVDPSHVKNQTDCVAEAFALAVEKERAKAGSGDGEEKEVMEKVEGWRAALREVANVAGMPLQDLADGHESKFIEKIARFIADKLNRKILSVPPYLIGIDFLNINSWLHSDSTKPGIVAIRGMGGAGKTTIAKCIFNLNFESFDGSSFLFNIRERSKHTHDIIRLQEGLLSDTLIGYKEKISSVDEGIIKITNALSCKRVLIVLDDVDKVSQLDAIIGARDWFFRGSKIIITTRNNHLLQDQEVSKIDIQKLNDRDSLELFSWHAFGQDHPAEGYIEHSKKVVKYCEGIPLALEVLGSSLNGKSVDVWKSAMRKLKEIPDSRIMERLEISYKSLQDYHDENLFLEIACFFVGEDKDHVVTILDTCDFYTTVGIQNLLDRCLLTVNKDNKLMMHQLLQNMASKIIVMEVREKPWQRTRLWNHSDSYKAFEENTGTETIEGLFFNKHKFNKHRTKFGSNEDMDLKTDAFTEMQKLRLLKINNFQLTGGYKEFPKLLRWLCWGGFPLESIPSDFPMERLVALDMCNSKLKQVWEGTKVLGWLKILNLSHSHALTRTPDFSGLLNLERLILKDCASLVEVHESIGKLETRLVLLNLKDCKELKKLPREINMLKVLETLDISGCSNLKELPTTLMRLKSLTTHTGGSFSLTLLPQSLDILTLAGGNLSDDAFTEEFSICHSPQSIKPSNNLLQLASKPRKNSQLDYPREVNQIHPLRSIRLSNNTFQTLVGLPSADHLIVRYYPSSEKATFQSHLCHPPKRKRYGYEKVDVDGVFKLQPIENIDEKMINNLGLYDLESVKSIRTEWYAPATDTVKKDPIQGLYEKGDMLSIFFPGRSVPGWFRTKVAGSSLSFTMPSLPNLRFRGLSVCCAYAFNRQLWTPKDSLKLGIKNETNGWAFLFSPNSCSFPEADEDMIWLSHWNFEAHDMEPGDELIVRLAAMNEVFKVKEIGIHLVYEEEENMGNKSNNQVVIEEINLSTDVTEIARLVRDCGFILRSIVLFPLSICSSFGSKFSSPFRSKNNSSTGSSK